MSVDLEDLLRWERAGGSWHLVRRDDASVEVGLTTCEGVETMARIHSGAADLIAYVTDGAPSRHGQMARSAMIIRHDGAL